MPYVQFGAMVTEELASKGAPTPLVPYYSPTPYVAPTPASAPVPVMQDGTPTQTKIPIRPPVTILPPIITDQQTSDGAVRQAQQGQAQQAAEAAGYASQQAAVNARLTQPINESLIPLDVSSMPQTMENLPAINPLADLESVLTVDDQAALAVIDQNKVPVVAAPAVPKWVVPVAIAAALLLFVRK